MSQHEEVQAEKPPKEPQLKEEEGQKDLAIEQEQPKKQRVIHLTKQYKFSQKYEWNPESFDPIAALSVLDLKKVEIEPHVKFQNNVLILLQKQQIVIEVTGTVSQGSNMNKHVGYTVKGKDKNGQFQIVRRYTEFLLLRSKLLVRWPGCYIPPIPNKTLIGNTEEEVKKARISFLNNFLMKLTSNQFIYFGEEFQAFLKAPENEVETVMKSMEELSIDKLHQKYQELFKDVIKQGFSGEEACKKFEEFQTYFKKWRVDLNDYKDEVRKLTEYKSRYYKAMSKVDQILLPDYQKLLLNWFKGITQQEVVIPPSAQQLNKTEEEAVEGVKKEAVVVEQLSNNITTGIINSEGYRSKLEDTANEIADYNAPIWNLYDILKFQLKETDAVIQAIEQIKYIRKEQDYLKRNIQINKEQIQSINNKKSTLKTFFMGGNEEQKRTKLTNQSKNFENKLEKVDQLLAIVQTLVDVLIQDFHEERAKVYRSLLKKSLYSEIEIIKKVMGFHIYQLQLLEKEKKSEVKGEEKKEDKDESQNEKEDKREEQSDE